MATFKMASEEIPVEEASAEKAYEDMTAAEKRAYTIAKKKEAAGE